jgi:molybdate transport system substrate-binding protein
MSRIFLVVAALMFTHSAAQSAELKVLSGNGSRAAVRELCTQFEQATGHKIDLTFGVNPEVKSKIEAGERFDVVVGNPPIIDALIKDGTVAGPRVDFGHAGLGVAVKSGAPKPDISSVEAFKRALLASNSVAFPARARAGSILSACSIAWASRLRCKTS